MEQTTISNRLTDERLFDLYTTAMDGVYGGCNYWAEWDFSHEPFKAIRKEFKTDERDCTVEYTWDAMLQGKTVEFKDMEDGETYSITLDKIKEGTEKFAMEHPEHYANALTDFDAETADVWFQICVIGELTFG